MKKILTYDRFLGSVRARHEPGAMRVITIVFWRSLLTLALMVFFGALACGLWEFDRALTILDTTKDETANQAPLVTRKDLESVAGLFEERGRAYDARLREPLVLPDPSQ